MLADAAATRKQHDFIAYETFRNNASKIFVLTRELSAASVQPLTGRKEKDLRNKGRELDDKLRSMIGYLSGKKPKKSSSGRAEPTVAEPQAIQDLTLAMDTLRSLLIQLAEIQGRAVDLGLTRSVLAQLEVVRTMTRRISGT